MDRVALLNVELDSLRAQGRHERARDVEREIAALTPPEAVEPDPPEPTVTMKKTAAKRAAGRNGRK